MDKEQLKQFAKDNDLALIVGGLTLGTIVISGMAAGVVASNVVRKHPVNLQFVLTPEFLANLRGAPMPAMNYNLRTR